ncbi:MAG: acetyl-CoA carboxylase biotin carboxyl carrier protein [Gloeocapsa sp. UFS-A4-WI-NPMV-4B04]|nr:acetyl-CoA carboxylase biotin carboxyl carrier protein [Gloeocapsa sp. UFS-A4-WI-NPMV-4B04]
MPLDFNEIRQLLVTIAQTDIAELTLKSDDFELTVRKAVSVSNQIGSGTASASGNVSELNPTPPEGPVVPPAGMETANNAVFEPGRNVPLPMLPTPLEQKLVELTSPMVGTFYRSPSPSEPPFAEVGDRIKTGQTVCIIEAMKLMNEIEAEVSGQIVEILVQNAEPVEYGQPLMRINPG